MSCSAKTQELYDRYQADQKVNKLINTRLGAMELFNTPIQLDSFLNTQKLWPPPGVGKFLDMMRYILADYYQTCRRTSPINPNHERTFFCECIIPIFKHFSVMIGSVSGEW